MLLLPAQAGFAGHNLRASDDLRVLFDTDDELELQVAAASLWQGGTDEHVFDTHMYVPVLGCVRSLVEERTGGLAGTQVAAEILAGVGFTVPHAAEELLQRCRAYRRDTARERIDRNVQARDIAGLRDYGDRVRTLLYRFIKPTTTCYSMGGRFNAGLLAVFGGDIAFEYCLANNGRHWLQTALEAEAGYGIGALLTWRVGNYRYRMNYLGGPFTYTKTRHRDWALGFGMTRAEYGDEYAHQQRGIIIAIPNRRSKSISAGLGAAYLRTWGQRVGLKFLPLGTRDERLLAEFAALSRRDLLLEQASIAAVLRVEEGVRLEIEYEQRADEKVVKFRLCSLDSSVCEDLLGGRYFALALLEDNLARVQAEQTTLHAQARRQRTHMIGAAIVSTAGSAPVALKNAVGKFSRTANILPSRWDGFDFGAPHVNEGGTRKTVSTHGRGFRQASTVRRQKIWQPLQEFLQKVFDSHPVRSVGETASKAVEAWNGLFVKLGRERLLSKMLRAGIPAVIIVGSGVTVLLTSLKLAKQELALEKVAAITTQQEEIFQLLQNPYHEVLVHDRTQLLQSLRFLVSQP